MKARRRCRPAIQFALLVAVLLAASSCASVPLKQRAVVSLQTAHAALAAADDLEQRLYDAQAVAALDAPTHRAISAKFVDAYRIEIEATIALEAWRAGDPVPPSLSQFVAVARETLDVANQLVKDNRASALIEQLEAWLARAQSVVDGLIGAN